MTTRSLLKRAGAMLPSTPVWQDRCTTSVPPSTEISAASGIGKSTGLASIAIAIATKITVVSGI